MPPRAPTLRISIWPAILIRNADIADHHVGRVALQQLECDVRSDAALLTKSNNQAEPERANFIDGAGRRAARNRLLWPASSNCRAEENAALKRRTGHYGSEALYVGANALASRMPRWIRRSAVTAHPVETEEGVVGRLHTLSQVALCASTRF